MGILSKLFGKKTAEENWPDFAGALSVSRPLFVVGDLHGRLDLLERLLSKQPAGTHLVFVGDLIDRGEQSAEVLHRVAQLCDEGAQCLMGNHERMMLDFLDDPSEKGPRWLRYGGLQTLNSFGLRGVSERASGLELIEAVQGLRDKMPNGMEAWLRALPHQLSFGNLHVVHAAASPNHPMETQKESALLWGHPQFIKKPRQDGQFVVHGHVIVPQAKIEQGCISIDTGGYATGNLTGAHFYADQVEFITA